MNLEQFQVSPPTIDWAILLPIIIVITTGVLALIIEMMRPRRSNGPIIWTSLIGLGVAALSVINQFGSANAETFSQMVVRDRPGLALQLVLIGTCFISFLFSENYLREKRIPFAEFYPLALWSTAGAMIMVTTSNLLMIFIGLEVLSISLYVMAGMARQESKSEESAIKYFLLGAFASAFLLYGIALIYGATGGLHLSLIAQAWALNDQLTSNLLIFGLGFILIGLGFKAAFVPFHQWTPDVYQGAPTNVTAFMAAAAKIAAIGALYRVLEAAIDMRDIWYPVLAVIAVLTMTIPNLIACRQKDVKRILGYSSIANAGYILVALLAHLVAPDKIGIETTIFFLMSYAVMTMGTFAIVSMTAKNGREGTQLNDLYGLWKREPMAAGMLVVFVASLIGIPITSGFFAKLGIFYDAVGAGLTYLAIILAINSAISCFYYLGMVRAAFVAEEGIKKSESMPMGGGLKLAILVCGAGVVALSLFISPIRQWVGDHDEPEVIPVVTTNIPSPEEVPRQLPMPPEGQPAPPR